ncbi:MAG: ThuA domain-containing protein [Planctomycetes bacterium]|nr:ThuA domain-containing protein [Planctomycetota bacterium]
MTTLLLLALLQSRGVFDYEGQKAAKDVRKIVLIGDAGAHGPPGNHEFIAGSLILARRIHAAYPNVHAVIHSTKNWPKDLSHADVVVVGLNHGGRAAKDPQIAAAVARGAGFMAIHFGVEVNKGVEGDAYLKWMGGYFETKWSVNPWWTPNFKEFPKHPITRGVTPFSVRDEWYYHMRFVPEMTGVAPILSDVPPLNTAQEKVSDRGGNPDVFKAVSEKQPQHMAWAYERPDGGRGFGFTGMHAHNNWGTDGFRVVLVNALAWVTKLEIPETGVASAPVTPEELQKVIEEAKAAVAAGR